MNVETDHVGAERIVVQFVVEGEPIAKERPRTVVNNGKARTFTPSRTGNAEAVIALFARQQMRGRPPETGRVGVALEFYRSTLRRCDIDNFVKTVLDACNKVVWADDCQVDAIHAIRPHRRYARPHTVVTIYRLRPDQGEIE